MPASDTALDARSFCPGCGYTLAGLPVPGTCPECSRRYFGAIRWTQPPPPSTLQNLHSFCGPLLWFFISFAAINLGHHTSFTLTLCLYLFAMPTLIFTVFAAPFWPFLASSKWLLRNAPPGLPNIGTFHAISAVNRTAWVFFVISVIGMPVPLLVTVVYAYFRF